MNIKRNLGLVIFLITALFAFGASASRAGDLGLNVSPEGLQSLAAGYADQLSGSSSSSSSSLGSISSIGSMLGIDAETINGAMDLFPSLMTKIKAKLSEAEQAEFQEGVNGILSGGSLMELMPIVLNCKDDLKKTIAAIKSGDSSILASGGAVDNILSALKDILDKNFSAEMVAKFNSLAKDVLAEQIAEVNGTAKKADDENASNSGEEKKEEEKTTGTVSDSAGSISDVIGALGVSTAATAGGDAAGTAAGATAGSTTAASSGAGASVSAKTDAASSTAATATASAGEVKAKDDEKADVGESSKKLELAMGKIEKLQQLLPEVYPPKVSTGSSVAQLQIGKVAQLLRARYRAARLR